MNRINSARGILLVIASVGLQAQSLSLPPSSVTHGASGSLLLALESPVGTAPVALQWEFTFPPNVLVEVGDIAAGSAAESVEKTLRCRAVEKPKDASHSSAYGCILAGGQKPIPNGPIAAARYRVPSEILEIPERVRVGKIIGTTADLKRIEIEDVQAAITIK